MSEVTSQETNAAPAQTPEAEAAAQAQLHSAIKAQFNNLVDIKEVKFHFKTVEDEATKEKFKRPTVELSVPVLSVEGLVAILNGGDEKQLALVMESLADTVLSRARQIVNDNESITQENFPLASLSWEAIANLPKSERRGAGIPKETWDDFVKDYVAIMPSINGKSVEQVTAVAKILAAKFQPVKMNKQVISRLKDQLGLYITNAPNAEQFVECLNFLNNKADALLQADEATLADSLGL